MINEFFASQIRLGADSSRCLDEPSRHDPLEIDIEYLVRVEPQRGGKVGQVGRERRIDATDPICTGQFGYLTLVEQGKNSSLGSQPFSAEVPVYAQSQLLLTRAIADKPKVGINTRINAAVADLEPFIRWTPAEIEARQAQLAKLAAAVWDVPALPASAPPSSTALP